MTDRDTVDPGVQTGDVIAGKYQVERILGIGGMGIVVAAHHMQLDEKVAIKLLRPEVAAKPDILTRFEREARAAVKIKSEHVARVIDVGRLDSGAPYMIMEYLEGGDLKAWLRDRGPMDAAQAAEFVLQVCEAVAEAHALGIVHRDLKPANLFCIKRADGLLSIKVVAAGLRRDEHRRRRRLSRVHVARAAQVLARRRFADRHLVARHHPLRAGGGTGALPGRFADRARHRHRDRRATAAP
jgi:serine/threonine-protein kinase